MKRMQGYQFWLEPKHKHLSHLNQALGEIKNVTISRYSGHFTLSIQTEREVQTPIHPSKTAVGVDLGLPEMDGYELIKQIRIDPDWAHLPIIALTAKVGTEEREKCILVGADDYLTKPIDEAMLLALLRVWVNQLHL